MAKTYKKFLEEAKVKKPNPYAKKEEKPTNPDFVYKPYPEHMIHRIGSWETIKTKHANERADQRSGGDLPGGHHDFMSKVIHHVSGLKQPKNGEYLYHSRKHDQGAVLYIHNEPKQIRVKTIHDKGAKIMTHAGDKRVVIEGVDPDIEVIILEDIEFEELFEQFVQEELGMNKDEFLDETTNIHTP